MRVITSNETPLEIAIALRNKMDSLRMFIAHSTGERQALVLTELDSALEQYQFLLDIAIMFDWLMDSVKDEHFEPGDHHSLDKA